MKGLSPKISEWLLQNCPIMDLNFEESFNISSDDSIDLSSEASIDISSNDSFDTSFDDSIDEFDSYVSEIELNDLTSYPV